MNIHPTNRVYRYIAFLKQSLKQNARALEIVIALFLAGVLSGGIGSTSLLSFVDSMMKGLVERFLEYYGWALFARIFINNFSAALIGAASGLLFGIFPLVSAFINGLFVGAVLFNPTGQGAWAFLPRLLSLTPHGIFELPAFFLALALGLRLGMWPFKKEKASFFKSLFNESSTVFFKIIIPFLILAAAIETVGIELLRSF